MLSSRQNTFSPLSDSKINYLSYQFGLWHENVSNKLLKHSTGTKAHTLKVDSFLGSKFPHLSPFDWLFSKEIFLIDDQFSGLILEFPQPDLSIWQCLHWLQGKLKNRIWFKMKLKYEFGSLKISKIIPNYTSDEVGKQKLVSGRIGYNLSDFRSSLGLGLVEFIGFRLFLQYFGFSGTRLHQYP